MSVAVAALGESSVPSSAIAIAGEVFGVDIALDGVGGPLLANNRSLTRRPSPLPFESELKASP